MCPEMKMKGLPGCFSRATARTSMPSNDDILQSERIKSNSPLTSASSNPSRLITHSILQSDHSMQRTRLINSASFDESSKCKIRIAVEGVPAELPVTDSSGFNLFRSTCTSCLFWIAIGFRPKTFEQMIIGGESHQASFVHIAISCSFCGHWESFLNPPAKSPSSETS